jgi:hypothetical protein
MKTQRKRRPAVAGHTPSPADPQQNPTQQGRARHSTQTAEGKPPLSRRAKLAISLLLLFHVGAVFLAALRIPPASELAVALAQGVRWYTEPLLVNPGYRFFAPDPGPSHMIRAEIVAADGTQHDEIYPDLKRQWPRLLYHRHFMLTSRLEDVPGDPESQGLADSYARHLFARHNTADVRAAEVRIVRRLHLLPQREQVLEGVALSDDRFYASPYNSPVGVWTSVSSGTVEATKLELRINADGTASLVGRVQAQPVKSSWTWRAEPPPGPRRLSFLEGAIDEPVCTAESEQEHELVLHYPLPGSGVMRVGGVEQISLRRDPTPLAVYAGE